MVLTRGFAFTHAALRAWEARFAPVSAERLRTKRRGRAGVSWYTDATCVKVHGRGCSLYRARDRDGNLLDSLLSQARELEAAKRFFTQALAVEGSPPERGTTDGHEASPRAIRETLGSRVRPRCNRYLNSRLEQEQRGVKQRSYPLPGVGGVESASRFGRAGEEVRQWFRARSRMKQAESLSEERRLFLERFEALNAVVMAA